MATPNLISQGVLIADKQYYNPNSHINSANLFEMGMKGGSETTDLGLVKTWSQIFRNVQPLYNFDQIAKQTIYAEPKGITWSTPIAMENPRIVEDLSVSDKPGQDGQEFMIAFDRPFSRTQTITYDHINNKYQLIITQEPYNDGDRWIHYVKIWGGDNKKAYISKEFLSPGTQWYQISAHRGDEYDNAAASFQTQVGERQWHYYLGASEIAYDFEISKKALLLSKEGATQEGNPLRVMELIKFQKDSEAFKYMLGEPSTNVSKILSDVYKGDKNALKGDIASKSWLFEIEKATMDKLMYDYVMNLMWGTGGRTRIETDTVDAAPGLYWQHRNYGNLVKYNLNQFSLDWLRNYIEQHFKFRMDFSADGTIIIKVGAGIYNIIEKEIKKEVAASGIIVAVEDSQRFLQGSRFELNFTMRYNAFFLKQFPQVKILMVHEPALDPVFANNISNPIVDGTHRLSSFTIILYDLNDIESDNIKLVKSKYDDKLRYMKEIGNIDWNDNNSTFIGNRGFSGIRGTMSMRHAGMLLVDPTKSLMFELNNPLK